MLCHVAVYNRPSVVDACAVEQQTSGGNASDMKERARTCLFRAERRSRFKMAITLVMLQLISIDCAENAAKPLCLFMFFLSMSCVKLCKYPCDAWSPSPLLAASSPVHHEAAPFTSSSPPSP